MTIPKGQKPICKMLEVIAQHVDGLRFEEKPDYELIIRTIEKAKNMIIKID